MLEQLVEAVDSRREHVAEALHEPVEVRRPSLHSLLEHLVQLAHHVADSRQVLALHLLNRALHALEHLVDHLLLQALHELLELLACLVVDELVIAQALDLAAKIVRQPVQLLVSLPRDALHQLLRVGGLRFVHAALDSLLLGIDHLLHLFAQLLHRRVKVVAAELTLARLAQLLEQLLEPRHVRRSPSKQPLEGRIQVAVVHQVIRERIEHVSGVEVFQPLGPVPTRVPELHGITLAGLQPPSDFSMARAALNAMSSHQLRATSCTPIGRPSGEVPARTTAQGLPPRLYGIV